MSVPLKYFKLTTLLIFAFFSCKEKRDFSEKKNAYNSGDSILPITQDSNRILYYYKFDSTKSFRVNILKGWIDTFKIDSRNFRLRIDSSQGLKIETYSDARWNTNVITDNLLWDFALSDVNKDGFPDLSIYYRKHHFIYFYDAPKHLFDVKEWDIMGPEVMLDSSKLIYYNFYEDDATPVFSDLYSLKETQPYFFYTIKYKNYEGANNGFVGLWQYKDGKKGTGNMRLIKKLKNCSREESDDFNCAKFWKDNYRTLVN